MIYIFYLKMSSDFNYFFILYFISFFIYSSSIIIIPFEIISANYELSSDKIDLMSYLYNLSLYSNFSIGNPPQQIKSFIKFDKSGFNIPYNAYNHEDSKTYQELDKSKKIKDEIEYTCTFSSDDIKLININSYNFSQLLLKSENVNLINGEKYKTIYTNVSFINKLSDEIGYKNYGYIGLKFPDKDKFGIINFVPLLKNNKIIKNYSWTLLFEEDDSNYEKEFITIDYFKSIKGKLILGDELPNYYPSKFDSNMSGWVNMYNRKKYLNWDIEFRNIYLDDFKLYIRVESELRPDSALFFGTLTFKLNIDIKFFEKYFKQEICQVKNMTLFPDIMYYVCDESISGENGLKFSTNIFPNITFEYRDFAPNFTLTYKDLFIQDIHNKNIYYFLFVFDRKRIYINKEEDRFILGMKFFEKYQFEFNNEKKIITHYIKKQEMNKCTNCNEDFPKIKNGDGNYKIILIICLSIIFAVILFVLGMMFQKKILKIPRKNRANELDEDYEYQAKIEENENEIKGLAINE